MFLPCKTDQANSDISFFFNFAIGHVYLTETERKGDKSPLEGMTTLPLLFHPPFKFLERHAHIRARCVF